MIKVDIKLILKNTNKIDKDNALEEIFSKINNLD
jgi:hypothetical protein